MHVHCAGLPGAHNELAVGQEGVHGQQIIVVTAYSLEIGRRQHYFFDTILFRFCPVAGFDISNLLWGRYFVARTFKCGNSMYEVGL